MEEIRRNIAANIQRLRVGSGMTQQELGEYLNYTDKAVSKWERGESVPDVGVLLKIANLFGVTQDHLVTDHKHDDEQVLDKGEEISDAVMEGKHSIIWEEISDAEFSELRMVVGRYGEGAVAPRTSEAVPQEDPSQTKFANLASVFGYTPGKFSVALMSAASVWLAAVITYVVLSVFVPSFDKAWICFVFAVPASLIVLLIFNLIWGEMRYSFTLMSALLWTALGSVFVFFLDKGQNWILFLIGIPAQILLLLWSRLVKRRRG